ncbi:unnamed protein product, partial [Onchocerca flexuosa]|uniref:Uncharacterized protein n=1 Tax=Onchocerca flexuosa TaxID=387005 RepID=A0A183HDN2_9BILA
MHEDKYVSNVRQPSEGPSEGPVTLMGRIAGKNQERDRYF